MLKMNQIIIKNDNNNVANAENEMDNEVAYKYSVSEGLYDYEYLVSKEKC